MTTTTSISSQSIGTSTNVGQGLFPQKVTKQTATTAFLVDVRITNGAGGYNPVSEVRVWYASSTFSLSAANAVTQLRAAAGYVDVRPSPHASGVTIRQSDLATVNGSYIYFWVDVPLVSVAQTLDVTLVELP